MIMMNIYFSYNDKVGHKNTLLVNWCPLNPFNKDLRYVNSIYRITFSKLSYLQLDIHPLYHLYSQSRERGEADNIIPDIRFQDTRVMYAIYRITFSKLSYLQLDIHPSYHLYSQSRERVGGQYDTGDQVYGLQMQFLELHFLNCHI